MRNESLTCLTVITKVTKRKPGRSSQKLASKFMSSPDVAIVGMPIQRASATRLKSRIPNSAAVMHPAPIPITGVQARTSRGPRSIRPRTHSRVTAATVGAAAAGAPCGYPREHGEAHRDDRHRHERGQGSRNRRGDDAPEERQPGREGELAERRSDNQHAEQRRPARDQRENRDPRWRPRKRPSR